MTRPTTEQEVQRLLEIAISKAAEAGEYTARAQLLCTHASVSVFIGKGTIRTCMICGKRWVE